MSRSRLILSLVALLVALHSDKLNGQCMDCPEDPVELHIEADNLMPVPGDQICYQVIANGFQNVVSVQFTLTFSANTLSYSSDNPDISGIPLFGSAFTPPPPGSNIYRVFWFDQGAAPNCAPNGTPLIEICFDVIGDPGQEVQVEIGNNGLQSPIEFGYVDLNSNECPNVPNLPFVNTAANQVPDVISSSCAGGPQIFGNEICGTAAGSRDGVVRLDIFCGTAPYSVVVDGTRTIDNITDDFVFVDNLAEGQRIFRLTDANGMTSPPIPLDIQVSTGITITTDVLQNPRCFNSASLPRGRIEISISGGTPYADGTYEYDFGGDDFGRDNMPQLIRLSAGIYSVTVRDSLGCSQTMDFELLASEVTTDVVSTTPTTCDGVPTGQIVVAAQGGMPYPGNSYTYVLQGIDINGDEVNRQQRTPTSSGIFDMLPAGEYVVYSEDDNPMGACEPVLTDTIFIGNQFTFSLSQASNDMVMCSTGEESAILTIVNGENLLTPFSFNIFDDQGNLVDGQMNITDPELITQCLPQGDYRIEIEDAATCMIVDSFTLDGCDLNIDDFPILVPPDCITMDGGSIILLIEGGTMPYDILWSNDSTTSSITDLVAGTYSVTVTDANACRDSILNIVLDPPLSFDLSLDAPPIMCPNGTTTITATAENGFDPYIYEWSPNPSGSTTNELMDVGVGTYFVTVTDDDGNGCPVEDSIVISLDNLAIPVPSIVPDPPIAPQCEGDSSGVVNISIPLTSDYAGPFSFEASSGEVGTSGLTFSPARLPAGEQWILYTDIPTGCTFDTVFFTVPDGPTLELDSMQSNFGIIQCFGEVAPFVSLVAQGNANVEFSWPDPISISGATVADVPAGTYAVTLTAGSCTSIVDITVAEPDSFGVIIDPNASSLPLCPGDLGILVARPTGGTVPLTFEWLDSLGAVVGNEIELVDASPGFYTVIVTDDNGCSDMDTIDITVNEPVEGFLGVPIQPFCFGDQGQVFLDSVRGGRPPYRYQLDTNPATDITDTSFVQSGDHMITVFDRNGCSWSVDFTIDTPDEVSIALNGDTELELGRSGELTADVISPAAIDTIIWSSDTGEPFECQTNDCTTISISPVNDATFSATVINVDSCTATASIDVNVIRSQNLYVPNIFSPNSILNDRNKVFQIYAGSGVEAIDYLRIYDRWGNKVHEEMDLPIRNDGLGSGSWDGTLMTGGGTIAGTPLESGVYIYVFQVRYLGDTAPEIRKGDVTLIR